MVFGIEHAEDSAGLNISATSFVCLLVLIKLTDAELPFAGLKFMKDLTPSLLNVFEFSISCLLDFSLYWMRATEVKCLG